MRLTEDLHKNVLPMLPMLPKHPQSHKYQGLQAGNSRYQGLTKSIYWLFCMFI